MRHGLPSYAPALVGHLGRTQLAFFEPDRGDNPAGGQGGQGGTQGTQPGDDRQQLQGLLQRHNNDAMAVIATLLSENHGLRDERRTLRGQLPAQGAVVLSGEDVTRWQAYQQLGAVDALAQQLQAAQTTQTELAGLKRGAQLRQIAEVAGYKESVLGKLPGVDKLAFEVREAQKDGKSEQTVVVKDGAAETPIAQYAETHWSDFLPALQAQTQASGTTFVRQSGSGTTPTTNPVKAYSQKAYRRAK
jgi:hypothetical protein